MASFLLKLDAFRKIPTELTNPTYHGAYLTILAYATMAILFFMEFHAYLSTHVSKEISIDKHFDEHIFIDFDVHMYELPCQYINVVVRDLVGNNELEVLDSDIRKEKIDSNYRLKGVLDKNTEILHQGDSGLDHHHVHREGEQGEDELESDWISTSDHFKHNDFDKVLEYHDFTMVNFYAEWCIHCRRFAPTWIDTEKTTDSMTFRDKNRQTVVTKLLRVNCVDFGELCARLGIRAYPTVRMYKKDKTFVPYTGERRKESIINFVEDFVHNQDTGKHTTVAHHSEIQEGCRVHGELKVRRVPGYFYLEASSNLDSLDPAMTNVSHRVNHMFISGNREDLRNYMKNAASHVTKGVLKNIQPMRSQSYVTSQAHQAPQHFLNVIPTKFDKKVTVYQSTVQSHIADVEKTKIPQARFQYVFSPLSIYINTEGRPLYDFMTSVFAIIGGTYTFVSLVERFWSTVTKRYKNGIQKLG